MNKVDITSPCPICKTFVEGIENMGLYRAECKIKGMIKGNKGEDTKYYIHGKESEGFLTFEEVDGSVVEWAYLELTVTELK